MCSFTVSEGLCMSLLNLRFTIFHSKSVNNKHIERKRSPVLQLADALASNQGGMCGVYVCVVGEIVLQFFSSPMGLLQTRGGRRILAGLLECYRREGRCRV